MPPLYRIIEVAVYALLNFLPFLILAIYPFRNHLRFSAPITWTLIAVLSLLQIGLGIWAAFFPGGHTALISAVSTILYAVVYFTAVKMPFGKTLFTLLMLSNTANFVVIAAKCIEGQIFHELALQSYRWSFSLMLLLVEIVVLIPLFFYITKTYTPAVEKEPSGFEWRYLWLIPATFYLVWYCGIYGVKERSSLEIALQPKNAMFFLFINLGAFLVYFVVTKLVTEQEKNLSLEKSNHRLVVQSLQYDNLQERIAEAMKAKHDVRHHITLMKEHLKNKDYDKLEEYLNSYQKSIPDDALISFCDNSTVNALLLYFAQQAKDKKIDFIVKLTCPEDINVSEVDLSVLFGNLLENALDACASDNVTNPSDKKIIIRGTADKSSLCLTVDNTFSGEAKIGHNGEYLSTKHKGYGIGIESVKEIGGRYNGTVQINQEGNLFMASVLLLCSS